MGGGADTVLERYHSRIAHTPDPSTALDRINVPDKAVKMVLLCLTSGEDSEGLDPIAMELCGSAPWRLCGATLAPVNHSLL